MSIKEHEDYQAYYEGALENINYLKQDIEKLKNKNEELNKICLNLSANVYRFLGNFTHSNLDENQKLNLDNLKNTIDSFIKSESGYKEFLEAKYIKKDLSSFNKISDLFEENLKEKRSEVYKLDDDVKEDDTETLIIKD